MLPLAILLDFDGTVVDSERVGVASMAKASEAILGAPFPQAVYDNYFGRSEAAFFATMATLYGAGQASAIRSAYSQAYLPLLLEIPPLPGVREGLARLAAMAPIVVVSGSRATQIAAYLEQHRLDALIHSIVGCEHYQRGKPDPQPFQIALAKIGVQPHQALVVEDSDVGVASGVAAGARVLGLRIGNPVGRYHLKQAHLCLDSLAQLSLSDLRTLFAH